MSNQPTLYILSNNRDFIEPFSCLVTRELGINCKTVETESAINTEGRVVIVSDKPLATEHSCPVIMLSLPIKINKILDEVEIAISSLSSDNTLQISADLQLSLLSKALINKVTGAVTTLTDKESQLLQIIVNAGENGASRDILLKEVWKMDANLDTHTLETHIYRLRKKMKDAFGDEMIKASEGGYRI